MTNIGSYTENSLAQMRTVGAFAVALGLATAIASGAGTAVAHADAGDPVASPSPASNSQPSQQDSGTRTRGIRTGRAQAHPAAAKAARTAKHSGVTPAPAAAVDAPAAGGVSAAPPKAPSAPASFSARVLLPSRAVTSSAAQPRATAIAVVPVLPAVPAAAAAGGTVAGAALPAATAMAMKASPAAAALGMSAGLMGQLVQAAAAQSTRSRRWATKASTKTTSTTNTSTTTNTTATTTPTTPATVPVAPALPFVVDNTNSFTTIYGTTAAGSVTVNGHTWVADPALHLYSTGADLALEWQTYYTQMKAGQGAALTDVQRLAGNAEAVFENTRLRDLSADQLSRDRQDVQRVLDAMSAAMVATGVDVKGTLTEQQYLAVENYLRSNATLEELAVQGHGLNNSGITRYAGYTNDFQNSDSQTRYIGGGLNNDQNALARFFDDNILTHMPFPTVVSNGVLTQLNQNGNKENTLTEAVAGLNAGLTRTYLSSDFLQPPRLVNRTAKQAFTNGQAFSFTIATDTFVDPQGQSMTYKATLSDGTALPSWVSFDTNTGRFSGLPPAGTTSSVVVVTATNSSGLRASESFTVQFKDPAPVVANQTPTQKASVGQAFSFTVPANTFADPLGQTLTYSASLSGGSPLPAWLTFDAQSGRFSGTAPAGTKSVGIVLTALTPSGVKSSESFSIQFTA